jgi:hypothetical protein
MSERRFLPIKSDARRFVLAIGIVAFVMVVVELASPRATAPTGRWSWLTAPIFEAFGSFGLAIVWAIVGLILVTVSAKRDG